MRLALVSGALTKGTTTMSDPQIGQHLHIGGKRRTFKGSIRALRKAQTELPGWMTVQKAMEKVDIGVLCILAAALLIDDDRTTTADHVEHWLEAEPELYQDVMRVVFDEIQKGYVRTMTKAQKAAYQKIYDAEMARLAASGDEPEADPLAGGPTSQG
jgi:hypothetical protein